MEALLGTIYCAWEFSGESEFRLYWVLHRSEFCVGGAGWRVRSEEIISQGGLRSVVILAEPQGTTAEGA
jgi:hypothetical protein